MQFDCEGNSPQNFKALPKNCILVKVHQLRWLDHFPYLNDLVVVGSIRFINGLQEGPRVLVSLYHI